MKFSVMRKKRPSHIGKKVQMLVINLSLTASDGHEVISVQTTGARMRDVCACRRHQRPPGLPGGVIRGGGLLHSSQLDAGSSRKI